MKEATLRQVYKEFLKKGATKGNKEQSIAYALSKMKLDNCDTIKEASMASALIAQELRDIIKDDERIDESMLLLMLVSFLIREVNKEHIKKIGGGCNK